MRLRSRRRSSAALCARRSAGHPLSTSSGADPSAALLGVAVQAVLGPRQGFDPLEGDRLPANLACAEAPGIHAAQRALDQAEVQFFALAQLLAPLALGDFRGGSRLGAVADPRVLDLFGQFDSNARALSFERFAGVLDELRVHAEHPTLLVGVVWALPGNRLASRHLEPLPMTSRRVP